jgi:hypothetical protein
VAGKVSQRSPIRTDGKSLFPGGIHRLWDTRHGIQRSSALSFVVFEAWKQLHVHQEHRRITSGGEGLLGHGAGGGQGRLVSYWRSTVAGCPLLHAHNVCFEDCPTSSDTRILGVSSTGRAAIDTRNPDWHFTISSLGAWEPWSSWAVLPALQKSTVPVLGSRSREKLTTVESIPRPCSPSRKARPQAWNEEGLETHGKEISG